jgi:hypothetical protein
VKSIMTSDSDIYHVESNYARGKKVDERISIRLNNIVQKEPTYIYYRG